MGEPISVFAPFPSCRGRLCCLIPVKWPGFDSLSSLLLSMGWALLLSRCCHRPPRTWLQWQEPRRWSVQSSLERSPLSCLTEMSAAGHPTVTEQTIHLFRQDSCNSEADHLYSRASMLGSPTPMKGRFQLRHFVFFLRRQWTSLISVSGRCHNRTSHWKGAVTLISTCLCQMLLLPSYLISSTASDSL